MIMMSIKHAECQLCNLFMRDVQVFTQILLLRVAGVRREQPLH